MKKAFKLLSVVLSFAMLFALCACNPSTKQPDDQNINQPGTPDDDQIPNNPGGTTDPDDVKDPVQTEEEWREEILSAELTEFDKSLLSDENNYEDKSLYEKVQNSIVIKIYRRYFLYVKAQDTIEDLIKTTKEDTEKNYGDGTFYLLLSDDPIRVGCVPDGLIGKRVEYYPDLDKACHIRDLLSLKKTETFLGEECEIQKVFYYENGIGTTYVQDVTVVFVTDKGNYVRYYNDYPWQTEGVVFEEAEFNRYAEAYLEYVIEHATDESGEPIGGNPTPFLEFVEQTYK